MSESTDMIKTGAEWLIHALEREGVDTLFGYPGGAIMPVYDALVGSNLKHILVRHEQGAALAAVGYARASGKVGVCMATSGPGATNLVTGIADAFMDSVPVVAITGQVPSHLMGTDAFQEVDVFGITLPIVKHSFIVRRPEDVCAIVREAFAIALEGRPGPVLIDLPKDVAVGRGPEKPCQRESKRPVPPRLDAIQKARTLIRDAKRPVLYIGGGVGMANAEASMKKMFEATRIPAVCTLKGLGAMDARDRLYLGMLGMHGNPAANFAVQEADLLIVVGARFDDRATGKLDTFAPRAKIIHLDADTAEIDKLRHADVALLGDLNKSLEALSDSTTIADWQTRCQWLKSQHQWRYDAPGGDIYAPLLLKQLSDLGGPGMIVSCDVGQHQMWVAQHCTFSHIANHLTSGGLGTMGFGLPAAIGAKLARPDAQVVCVSGDGSIMMNIQELATLYRYGIPVKVIVIDNAGLGMVRQWQELFFNQRFSEVDLSDNPDFSELARAFRIPARTIDRREQVLPALKELLEDQGSRLLHVRIDAKRNVWPLVPPGKSNADMIEEHAP
ncbi:acetolactate synthase 2 catalytic subunit [Ahniella affigens]|uniref:Acetolactate synthase n=1 Tax=Ahniella affigens TaxID=2021234 RepID=A0A2P1PT44_9GAMM|nr:acetolactate synthase 2 catalytic subunit [Ahniella affigens]